MNIQVDTLSLIDRSNGIKIIKSELLRIMEDIELLVLSVNGEWQGDAERVFSEKILYVKKQFESIAVFFEDYSEVLKNFAYEYEQQENDLLSKISFA